MKSEEANKQSRKAWSRLLRKYQPYLRKRAEDEGLPTDEFVKRVNNHSWWTRDHFLNHRHCVNALSFREWLFNRVISDTVRTWNDLHAHGTLKEKRRGSSRWQYGVGPDNPHLNADGTLKENYKGMITRIAYEYSVDPNDLSQEVSIAVGRYWPNYDNSRRPFPSWLSTIAHNAAKKLKKPASKAVKKTYCDEFDWTQLADSAKGPDEIAVQREMSERLKCEVVRLRERNELAVEILQLRIIDGLEYPRSCADIEKIPDC